MRRQRSGAIVNISSLGGQLSFGGFSAYSASKFALEGMSEALAAEVAPFGIKVLIVEPGAFRTSFAADSLKHMPVMEAYRDVVGGTREFARGMHGTQAGNPDKVGAAIELALAANPSPLRLPLGADAVSSSAPTCRLVCPRFRGHPGRMSDSLLILGVRLAGGFHFVTLVLACFTPIPPDWDRNLAALPPIHRRFAIAQNISIGAMIAVLGLFSLCFAPDLVAGTPLARAVCAATAVFWGGRALVLPWLGVRPVLTGGWLRLGYALLLTECIGYAVAYGYLALR